MCNFLFQKVVKIFLIVEIRLTFFYIFNFIRKANKNMMEWIYF